MINPRIGLCFVLICSSCIVLSNAQRYPFFSVNVKDGLPQSSVFKIIQDQQGYLWMATEAGLARYDGYEFRNYSIHDGIGARFISDIAFDQHGKLWVSTHGKGIASFDGMQFTSWNRDNGFPSNQIRCMIFSQTGELWASSLDSGLIWVRSDGKPQIMHWPDNSIVRYCWKLIEDSHGNIWVACKSGVIVLRKSTGFALENTRSPEAVTLSLFESPTGEIWAGGRSHLYMFRNDSCISLNHYLDPFMDVWDIFQETESDPVYLATNHGLMMLDLLTGKRKILTTDNGLSYDHLREIYKDRFGNFWLGSYGGGATIVDGKGMEHFEKSVEGFSLAGFTFAEDHDGTLWLGTDTYGYFFFDGKQFHRSSDGRLGRDHIALCSTVDPATGDMFLGSMNGSIWRVRDRKVIWTWEGSRNGLEALVYLSYTPDGKLLASGHNGIFLVDPITGQSEPVEDVPQTYYRSTFVDDFGFSWLLTDEGQVFRLGPKGVQEFTDLINPDLQGMDMGMYDKQNGIWWFCSNSGLILWNGKERFLLHSKNGLKSDAPWSITQDKFGRIWIGHEKGVEYIDVPARRIRFIGYDQGFIPVETNSTSIYSDRNGDIWFGTISSATRIVVDELVQEQEEGLLRLQSLKAGKKVVFDENFNDVSIPSIELRFNQNDLEFGFVALCFGHASDVRYSWILEGADDEWQIPGKRREAIYSNLPPGDYKFRINAIDPNGSPMNEVTMLVTIHKPFWNRLWFYALEVSLLGLFIFLSFRFSSDPSKNRLGNIMTILTILIIFESLLFYVSPFFDKFTAGIPIFQLVLNIVFAATLQPLEQLIRRSMNKMAQHRQPRTAAKI